MFKGKTVIVTGASSGIGAAVAKAFAKEGAAIAICGRNEERLSSTAEQCRSNGARDVLDVIVDLSKDDEVVKFGDKIKERFSNIDILVNNAASAVVSSYLETTMEEYTRIFNVNVRAPFHLTQLLLPSLAKSEGCVINVSSITATTILPKGLVYGMSKAALNHFTEALSFECARRGVRVNGVSPATVKTRQLAGDTGENKLTPEQTDATMMFMANVQPFGTLNGIISADDVANTVIFLASPSASNITGQTIKIEAGYNPYHAMEMH